MSSKVPHITLNNGITIPQLGLGVWQAQDGDEVEKAVTAAISAGYRSFDTAAVYGNEAGVGQAIAKSSVDRKELFITSKVWNSDQGYESTLKAFHHSLKLLGLDYIDMYLIHWPMPKTAKYLETWKAMEELYNAGKIKVIGVCNFQIPHLQNLIRHAKVLPALNQIELHPYFPQLKLRQFCKDNGIAIESWSPIGGSGGAGARASAEIPLLLQPDLVSIGKTYGKTPAQIVIRWHLQHDLIVIPKSVHEDRIKENIDVFDFHLSVHDMESIDALETGVRGGPNPDEFEINVKTSLIQRLHKIFKKIKF